MGKARKAHTAGDLWHLSIDDLLMPPGESPEAAGSGPFVLNLSSSTATIPPPPARMPRFEGLRIYHVRRAHEDGEHGVQFRLRLGIIHSALEADAILASVREHYPGATLESATDEDESAVAEATVTQPQITSPAASNEAAAATPGSVSSESKKADTARSSASATPSPQRQAAPKAPASLLPDVPLEPIQEMRWDIDDLLPDLPVTRPSQPQRPANERPAVAANARGRKGRHPAPPRKAPAEAAAEIASATAETPLPVIAAEMPATPAPEAVAVTPAPADEIFASLAMVPAPAEVVASHADVSADLSAALAVEALPPEVSAPAAAELARPIALDAPEAAEAGDDFNFDFDSNADTVEVEALVMMLESSGDSPDPAQDAAAREPVVVAEAPVVSAADTVAEIVFELDYLDPAVLDLATAPTIAPAVPDAPVEASSPPGAAATESVAEPMLSDTALTQEVFFEIDPPPATERMANADSVTVEAPALWRDASLAAAIASVERDLNPDSVTVEALALDIRTPAWTESPWTLNEAGDDTDAHAMEALAAKISAQSVAEIATVAAAVAEPVAQEPEANADSPATAASSKAPEADPLSDSQTLEEVVAKLDARSAEATLAAAPVPKEDSQTLEVLVAKIGALVESAAARDSSESTLLAEAVPPTMQSPNRELAAEVEPAARIDAPRTVAASIVVATAPAVAVAALPEPLVRVEPLAVVEWEPIDVTNTVAAASAQAATPVATAAPAPTATGSWPIATTAKIRMRAPAGPPAQWPIAPTAKPTPQASPPAPRSSSPESARASQPQRAPAPPEAPPSPEPIAEAAAREELPAFDSTQTIRALTFLELQNGQSSKSFSIQLLLTEEPIHPEQIPKLDIFEAYRLYVVTGLIEERVMHALRLGFFTSEVAAEAVAGYLKGYFEVTSIKRVSLAEHDRFQERRVTARKDVGDSGKHAAIELTSRPDLPERRAKVQEAPAGKQGASSSIWSRLVSPLKR